MSETESLHIKSWASGLIDGEGCFLIEAKKYPSRKKQVIYRPRFSVQLREDDLTAIKTLQSAIGEEGYVYFRPSRKASKHGSVSSPTVEAMWRSKPQIKAVIEMLDAHPLFGKKRLQFERWKTVCLKWIYQSAPTEEIEAEMAITRKIIQNLKKFETQQ